MLLRQSEPRLHSKRECTIDSIIRFQHGSSLLSIHALILFRLSVGSLPYQLAILVLNTPCFSYLHLAIILFYAAETSRFEVDLLDAMFELTRGPATEVIFVLLSVEVDSPASAACTRTKGLRDVEIIFVRTLIPTFLRGWLAK